MKILMRAILSSLLAFSGSGCAWPKENDRETQAVNATALKPNEIQHEQLSEDQLNRITKLHTAVT